MRGGFEWFVAARYLRAKRKQAVISVITVISVVGVAAGVMALVVALAVNNGFKNTLQRNLLGATAHVSILDKQSDGIHGWEQLAARLRKLPHVRRASPALYGPVFLTSPVNSAGAELKGVPVDTTEPAADVLLHLKQGSFTALRDTGGMPGIILGAKLAENAGAMLDSVVTVVSPQGEMTPFGPRPSYFRFRVAGIFESGFYDLDVAWAFTSLAAAQRVFAVADVVNSIELKLDDPDRAPEVARAAGAIVGSNLSATTWMEQNRQVFNAFRMEKRVTVVTIGLIQLVASLNILIALVMMVMEKHRDVAILISMGARVRQIRKIFMLQGMLIGGVGTAAGLTIGYLLCYFANKYQWLKLDAEVYSLSFVPFNPRWQDGIWIAAAAILVSFLATLYPARNAARVAPVEALRYE
ncbi:MAG: ABC transporter permease [Bryobacteraceae bacterium]